ncbi:oxidoreductase [Apiospora aurea]|uniref:Oxidoreductase n=1 Tax=Apiospora aurea TaxID=335848 RepID=A0ABR1QKU2_9PEZI
MSQPKVLVVGASIAGPMTAYWLARAGAQVTVIERFPHLRTNGQNVDIRTVGVTVMRRIPGMEEAVRAKVLPMKGIGFVDTNGRRFGTLSATGNPDQQSLVSEYEILRGALSRVLYDLTKDNKNIRYVFGEQAASMKGHHGSKDGSYGEQITVEFINGHPTATFDLVVACDGATSRTRAMGLGCGIRDYVQSTNAWAAYYSTPPGQDLLKGASGGIGHGYNAVGGRMLGVDAPDAATGSNRLTFMQFNPRSGGVQEQKTTQPFREAVQKGDEALREFVSEQLTGTGWICDEAAGPIAGADDFYASELVQVKLPSLYKGRFALVGDAGYDPGPTGTGKSLAMAGAYVLAGEIHRHRGDLGAGLKGYDDRMRPIVAELQKIPPLIHSFLAPQTAWGIWLRNNIFAFVCWTGFIDFAQKYFSAAFAETDKTGLPDYFGDVQ